MTLKKLQIEYEARMMDVKKIEQAEERVKIVKNLLISKQNNIANIYLLNKGIQITFDRKNQNEKVIPFLRSSLKVSNVIY